MPDIALNVRQFQKITAICLNDNLNDLQKKISVVAIAINKSFEEVNQCSIQDINQTAAFIFKRLDKINTGEIPVKHVIKIGGKRFQMARSMKELKANQLVEFMEYDTSSTEAINSNMHKILASLAREIKWMHLKPSDYDPGSHPERAELFLDANIFDVFGYIGFFLTFSEILQMNLRDVLEQEMMKI